jgi:hypothetical protein
LLPLLPSWSLWSLWSLAPARAAVASKLMQDAGFDLVSTRDDIPRCDSGAAESEHEREHCDYVTTVHCDPAAQHGTDLLWSVVW